MDKPHVFFNPIVNKDEKIERLQALIDAKAGLLVKSEDGYKTHIFPNKFSGDRGLLCAIKEKADLEKLQNKNVVMLFTIDQNYYFFESKCLKALDQIGISFKSPIYLLQQRANARIDIPEDFKLDFLLTKHKNLTVEHHCKFVDISLGGCKIVLLDFPENIVKDDTLEAEIRLPSKKSFSIKGQVKNVKLENFVEKSEVEKIEHKKHDAGIMFLHDPKQPKDFEKFYLEMQHEYAQSLKTTEED